MYVVPECDPPDAVDQVLNRVLKYFPQCNDQLLKSDDPNAMIPHISVARYPIADAEQKLAILNSKWQPVSFMVNHLYMAHRPGMLPFEVCFHM